MTNSVVEELLRLFLPDSLKANLSRKFFYTMSHSFKGKSQVCDMNWSLENLKRNGFAPKVIIDIGAYTGAWTKMTKGIFPDSYFLMIEAQPDKEECLKQVKSMYSTSVDYRMSLLGARRQDGIQYFQMESGSSVLSEQSNVPRRVLTLSMET